MTDRQVRSNSPTRLKVMVTTETVSGWTCFSPSFPETDGVEDSLAEVSVIFTGRKKELGP
jgi:hypothetical protein